MNCRYRMRNKALWVCKRIRVAKGTQIIVNWWRNPHTEEIENSLCVLVRWHNDRTRFKKLSSVWE